jgi:HlyD family secretion protein
VTKAELDLKSSENSLYDISELKDLQAAVDEAQTNLILQRPTNKKHWLPGMPWLIIIPIIPDSGTDQCLKSGDTGPKRGIERDRLHHFERGGSANRTSLLTVKQKERAVEEAKIAVEDAKTSVTNAETDVTDAQQDLANAQFDAEDAQADLDEAKNLSPIITAPFSGFITKVNISGGDEVQKGTVAMTIADPEKYEANIVVSEYDIFSVVIGGQATVALDALSDMVYPAEITDIAPTATVSSGVVNYEVTVELTSLEPQSTNQFPGAAPVNSEQTESVTLKDGLSATVEIISEQVTDVLILPSKALTRQGQGYSVQVENGTTSETRNVQTGLTDGTNTEITEGLSEGEQVVYTVSTSSSSSSSSNSGSTTQGMQGLTGGGSGGPPPGGF